MRVRYGAGDVVHGRPRNAGRIEPGGPGCEGVGGQNSSDPPSQLRRAGDPVPRPQPGRIRQVQQAAHRLPEMVFVCDAERQHAATLAGEQAAVVRRAVPVGAGLPEAGN